MPKIKCIFLTVFNLLLLQIQLRAQETNETCKIIGFGRCDTATYLAYEIYGIGGGEPENFSFIRIVDVDSNVFVEEKVGLFIKHDDSTNVRSLAYTKAIPIFKKYNIDTMDKGRLLYKDCDDGTETLRYDVVKEGSHILREFTIKEVSFRNCLFEVNNCEDIYTLMLKEHKLNQSCSSRTSDEHLVIFELSIERKSDGKKIILQKDTVLPKSRSCIHKYGIHEVYMSRNNIVVFLHAFQFITEGPNNYKIIVTGEINWE